MDDEADPSRLYTFPGGILELQSYGDENIDHNGFYLELHVHSATEPYDQRTVMRWRPTCLGYLRSDISGIAQLWDESQIRRLAERFGYDLAAVVVYDPQSGRPPLARLRAQATRLDAEAVIVPSPDHFESKEVLGSLIQQLDVITVSPEATYARRPILPLRSLPPARSGEA